MRLGILEADSISQEVEEKFGTLTTMFSNFFQLADPQISCIPYAAHLGQLPQSPSECDGWVVSGSKASANDETPWMLALEAFIRQAADLAVPTIGICFGHQLMAKARGGKVERTANNKWGMGINHYRATSDLAERPDWMTKDAIRLQAMHQDQVTQIPPQATCLAGSEFCPNGMILYPGNGLSTQLHPEIRADFSRYLIEQRQGSHFPFDESQEALRHVDGSVDDATVARWMLHFLQQSR